VSRLQRSGRRLAPLLPLLSAAAVTSSHLQLLDFIVVVLHLLLLLSDGLFLERARHDGDEQRTAGGVAGAAGRVDADRAMRVS
jgi:hypothetical protein